MRETARDREIVKLVYDYRMLSQRQLERVLGKARSTTQQALVRLYHHQYLDRVFMPVAPMGSSPTLYVLGRRGNDVLRQMGVTDFTGVPGTDLSPMFLEHTLAINDFRIAVQLSCEMHGWDVVEWKTENEIKADYDRVQVRDPRGRTQTIPVVPDSYFVIEIPGRGQARFFIELDRGTMSLERFRHKVQGYVAYYKSGLYNQRYEGKGFRVLTVVDTPGRIRMRNLVEQAGLVPGIGRRFWFGHLPDLQPETVLHQPVWTVAGDGEGYSLIDKHENGLPQAMER